MLTAALLFLSPVAVMAQDEVEATVKADFVSHYMWRGIDKGGLAVQPMGELRWKGLSLSAWGNAPLKDEDPTELNIKLGYKWNGWNAGIIDYWTKGVDYKDRYLYYDNAAGPHVLEANIGYTCLLGSVQAYTRFFGPDYRPDGKRAFSTMVEVSVPFKLATLDWQARVGLTAFKSQGTREVLEVIGIVNKEYRNIDNYLYAGGPACIEAALRAGKDIVIDNNTRVPAFIEVQANPYTKQAGLVMGIGIVLE